MKKLILSLFILLLCSAVSFPRHVGKAYSWLTGGQSGVTSTKLPNNNAKLPQNVTLASVSPQTQTLDPQFQKLTAAFFENYSKRLQQDMRDYEAIMAEDQKNHKKMLEADAQWLKEGFESAKRQREELEAGIAREKELRIQRSQESEKRWRRAMERSVRSSRTPQRKTSPPKRRWLYEDRSLEALRRKSFDELMSLPHTPKDANTRKWAKEWFFKDSEGRAMVADWAIEKNTYNPVAALTRLRRTNPGADASFYDEEVRQFSKNAAAFPFSFPFPQQRGKSIDDP